MSGESRMKKVFELYYCEEETLENFREFIGNTRFELMEVVECVEDVA